MRSCRRRSLATGAAICGSSMTSSACRSSRTITGLQPAHGFPLRLDLYIEAHCAQLCFGWARNLSPCQLATRSQTGRERADLPGPSCLLLRAARYEDGDEDDVVAAKHDFERAQRRERSPGFG